VRLNGVIICVDDEKIVLDSLYGELNFNLLDEFDIELAQSGEEAIEIIEDLLEDGETIPLIISDFIMPNMKGDEFLIKAHELVPDTNKIMLTGQSSIEGVTNAINYANLYRFVSKPWDSSDLILTVNAAIKDFFQRDKIKKNQEYLEEQVKLKTKQLEDLNKNLEQKVLEEISKNREKEQQLAQQSRTSMMGEMMAAITHQWKQPLAAISAINEKVLFMSQMNKLTQETIEQSTATVKQQIEHMSKTMNDFKNFFKPAVEKEYEIKSVIDDVMNLIGDILKSKGISIIVENNENSYKTIGFDNELTQVIINIINNARDAIEENKCECKDIIISFQSDDEFHIISIQDSAGGIPEEIINNIFDPYFTTKCQDKGTGIGLDMSKSIINKVSGKIEVENKIQSDKKGACFKIYLKQA
jgi:C4-dicarboxylate-specific signal transduction histidine kinase